MRKMKSIMFLLSALAMVSGLGTIDAYARTKITNVSIKVEADISPDTEYGEEEIDVTVKTGKCEFVSYEVLNDDNEWALEMVPKVQIVLEAADDYYFPSSLTASKIKVAGGTYVSAARAEDSTQLKITMTLPSLMTYIGEMGDVSLNQDGIASWEPVVGAGSYTIRLYRDGSSTGSVITTSKANYDLSPAMLRSGGYHVRVRAINGVDDKNKSTTSDSNTATISDESAARNKDNNTGKPGEWKQDETGWWYSHGDGSYTISGWEKICGSWFAFDASGYMQTGWVILDGNSYYFNPENGVMLTNTTVDDRVLGEDGAMIQ